MPVAVQPSEENVSRNLSAVGSTGVPPQRLRKGTEQLTVVESITRPTPQWLPLIISLRKGSTPVALVSLAAVLLLYGVSAVVQREWGTQYETLESLKTQQDTLITQVEKTKYRIPRELEIQPKNFVDLNQQNTIFVQPEAPSPVKSKPNSRPYSSLRDDRTPLGY